ncbi:transcription factor bHLH93 [Euphorbia lathyris]|uniref:transcription factor bHLH93 n=1 Tax=Euphorbia lathyris TaxID=212925 RepID=UPI0033134341
MFEEGIILIVFIYSFPLHLVQVYVLKITQTHSIVFFSFFFFLERESMELSHQHGFLDELLEPPRRETWVTFPSTENELFSNAWNLDQNTSTLPNLSFLHSEPTFEYPFHDQTYPFFDGFSSVPPPEINTSPPFPSMLEDGTHHNFEFDTCKVEMEQPTDITHNAQVFNMGSCGDNKKNKSKKLDGQPSKNLMAERRRRKRLNDRLSMLRSIVPKISKMDRTSILGDTIDYMKELLDRISKLQEEEEEEEGEEGVNEANLINTLKEVKPNEALVRNSPKFNVERRKTDTRIDICCSSKPGLLLSTVNTLEALGLEIQQCVISCFNDFSMQASCSEGGEQRTILTPEDIKQALFRTAGYGGRCL